MSQVGAQARVGFCVEVSLTPSNGYTHTTLNIARGVPATAGGTPAGRPANTSGNAGSVAGATPMLLGWHFGSTGGALTGWEAWLSNIQTGGYDRIWTMNAGSPSPTVSAGNEYQQTGLTVPIPSRDGTGTDRTLTTYIGAIGTSTNIRYQLHFVMLPWPTYTSVN